jgi:hypothetical protein
MDHELLTAVSGRIFFCVSALNLLSYVEDQTFWFSRPPQALTSTLPASLVGNTDHAADYSRSGGYFFDSGKFEFFAALRAGSRHTQLSLS